MRGPLTAWGRLVREEHTLVPLRSRAAIAAALHAAAPPGIPHGNGRSYGDVCLNGGGTAWLTRGLDRFIAFDAATGVVRCEAGVTLAELIEVTLPRGWFLPVTPGTRYATLGGAVANDVHGKNHHRHGTFGEHVRALVLHRTDGRVIACGPALEPAWFTATVGGLGLTGVIAEVELQLRRVAGPWIDGHAETFETLDAFFALSARHAAAAEYTVAWVDCGAAAGGSARADTRGVFFRGEHSAATEPLPRRRGAPSMAALPPLPWVNPLTSRAFNALYFGVHRWRDRRAGPAAERAPVRQRHDAFFYPLDGIGAWNRIYGAAGFYQYQCVVPQAVQADAVRELMALIRQAGSGSFLSVLKTFGARAAPGLMSFPMAGTTLALDFPNRGPATLRLFDRLNAVVAAAGGRLYPAKDAAMPAALFRRGYPNLDAFERFRDPGIASDLSRRLFGR